MMMMDSSPPIAITAFACDSYLWNGVNYTVGGSYDFTTLDACGCDSTIILDISIAYSDSITVIDTAYNAYTWNSQLITNSGVYTNTFTNSDGCDSIMVLELTIITTNDISDWENLENKRFRITNMLGQEIPFRRNTPLLYLYDDGRVEKRIIIEK